jgi:hypothetical protein
VRDSISIHRYARISCDTFLEDGHKVPYVLQNIYTDFITLEHGQKDREVPYIFTKIAVIKPELGEMADCSLWDFAHASVIRHDGQQLPLPPMKTRSFEVKIVRTPPASYKEGSQK